jgi:hypothetical protein
MQVSQVIASLVSTNWKSSEGSGAETQPMYLIATVSGTGVSWLALLVTGVCSAESDAPIDEVPGTPDKELEGCEATEAPEGADVAFTRVGCETEDEESIGDPEDENSDNDEMLGSDDCGDEGLLAPVPAELAIIVELEIVSDAADTRFTDEFCQAELAAIVELASIVRVGT